MEEEEVWRVLLFLLPTAAEMGSSRKSVSRRCKSWRPIIFSFGDHDDHDPVKDSKFEINLVFELFARTTSISSRDLESGLEVSGWTVGARR